MVRILYQHCMHREKTLTAMEGLKLKQRGFAQKASEKNGHVIKILAGIICGAQTQTSLYFCTLQI